MENQNEAAKHEKKSLLDEYDDDGNYVGDESETYDEN